MLRQGEKAPDIELKISDEESIRLSEPGRIIVLFFYPKAFSKICTAELCQVRNVYSSFQSTEAMIIGISRDSEKTQAQFKSQYNLPFSLLTDHNGSIAKSFGVTFGSGLIPLTLRATFVIDGAGNIRLALKNMLDAEIHVKKALAVVEQLVSEREPSNIA